MSRHFYAFGSICRGEVDSGSDIDLLACTDEANHGLDPQKFSIYTHRRVSDLWAEGNPFAWHLHLESKLLFASDGKDFLKGLGKPAPYGKGREDCSKFSRLFAESSRALKESERSSVFHLSCIFLAVRNFATCHSLSCGRPIFSRRSPLLIEPAVELQGRAFDIMARARILSTRGYGPLLTHAEVQEAALCIPIISKWMRNVLGSLDHE